MTTTDRQQLKIAKLNWRESMRRFFGKGWTKRIASTMQKDGTRRMNTSIN